MAKGLTVRQTEALVRKMLQPPAENRKQEDNSDIRVLQERLSEQIGVPVLIEHSAKGRGKLTLKYNSLDELEGILEHIK